MPQLMTDREPYAFTGFPLIIADYPAFLGLQRSSALLGTEPVPGTVLHDGYAIVFRCLYYGKGQAGGIRVDKALPGCVPYIFVNAIVHDSSPHDYYAMRVKNY